MSRRCRCDFTTEITNPLYRGLDRLVRLLYNKAGVCAAVAVDPNGSKAMVDSLNRVVVTHSDKRRSFGALIGIANQIATEARVDSSYWHWHAGITSALQVILRDPNKFSPFALRHTPVEEITEGARLYANKLKRPGFAGMRFRAIFA